MTSKDAERLLKEDYRKMLSIVIEKLEKMIKENKK